MLIANIFEQLSFYLLLCFLIYLLNCLDTDFLYILYLIWQHEFTRKDSGKISRILNLWHPIVLCKYHYFHEKDSFWWDLFICKRPKCGNFWGFGTLYWFFSIYRSKATDTGVLLAQLWTRMVIAIQKGMALKLSTVESLCWATSGTIIRRDHENITLK